MKEKSEGSGQEDKEENAHTHVRAWNGLLFLVCKEATQNAQWTRLVFRFRIGGIIVFVLLIVVEIWDHLDAKWSKSGLA